MARHYRLWRAPARVCAAGRLTFFYGMVSVRLRISGRVQGVGFRYAMQAEAERRGLGGWVRNRRDGTVEALVHGDAAALEALVEWARRGPPGARVDALDAESAAGEPAQAGFELRPTV